LDKVLLGPVEPTVYWPDYQTIQQIQVQIPKLLTMEEIKPLQMSGDMSATIDKGGNVVMGIFDDKKNFNSPTLPSTPASQSQPAPVAPVVPKVQRSDAFLDAWMQSGKTITQYIRDTGIAPAEALVKLENADTFNQGRATAIAELGELIKNGGSVQSGTFPRTIEVSIDAVMVRSLPNSLAPLAGSQRLVRGDKFVAVALVDGENVSGISKWYLSEKGNYVWSGGGQ
jgi:hypothetical protein